jgi:autotransporter passenger strand-loop-strand repeat protein
VLSGGTATATDDLGGQLIVSAGGREASAILSGATEVVFGTASGTLVSNSDQILSGGVAFAAVIAGDSGLQLISAGSAYGASVGSGAIQTVYSGALASGTTLSGGSEVVGSGGVASATGVLAGGSAVVQSGGSLFGASVAGGGQVEVESGGSAYATSVGVTGVLQVTGGTAVSTWIGAGGTEALALSGAGSDSAATIGFGGLQTIGSGGIAYGATVLSGGVQELVSVDPFAGGSTSQTALQSGGAERILANGTAYGTVVSRGGFEVVSSGGTASGTVVRSGGIELVLSGGASFSAAVDVGGSLVVLPGGNANPGTFEAGGPLGGPAVVLNAPTVVSTWTDSANDVAVGSGAVLYVLSGGVAVSAVIDAGGRVLVGSGGSAKAAVIGASGVLELQAGAVAGGGVTFSGGAAELAVAGTELPSATLSGLRAGDSIDLLDIAPGAAPSATLDSSTDVLTVSAGGGSFALTLAGNFAGARFQVTGDGASGSLVSEVPCYAAGTRIATVRGDVPVEALAPGDLVHAQNGRLAPVRWVGRRDVDCRRHPWPERVMPVRIAVDAFGRGQPRRPLLLSPDHAVFVDGVLVPVRYLVNGMTVAQVPVARIAYLHVELDRHDVILAEGLPAESFLDTGNRGAFANGGAPTDLHPEFARRVWQAEGCAELVLAGARLAEVRRGLLARAAALGHPMTDDPALAVASAAGRLGAEVRGGRWRVRLPEGTTDVVLRSRTWTPVHADPAAVDTRSLGVALARLFLDGREVVLDSPALAAGWHAAEPGLRWTDGAGTIPVDGVGDLAFELAMTGRYWTSALTGRAAAATARGTARASVRR